MCSRIAPTIRGQAARGRSWPIFSPRHQRMGQGEGKAHLPILNGPLDKLEEVDRDHLYAAYKLVAGLLSLLDTTLRDDTPVVDTATEGD